MNIDYCPFSTRVSDNKYYCPRAHYCEEKCEVIVKFSPKPKVLQEDIIQNVHRGVIRKPPIYSKYNDAELVDICVDMRLADKHWTVIAKKVGLTMSSMFRRRERLEIDKKVELAKQRSEQL